jgi:subtilisin family serine protease
MNGVDVATDGTDVTINTYGEQGDGTSYSAPTVAGLIGDMIAADPTLTPEEIEATLKASAKPVTGQENLVGAGIIDRDKAMELVTSAKAHQLLEGESPVETPTTPGDIVISDESQAIIQAALDAIKAGAH